jgi:NADPH-dependent 2,4-dienoyl-CoA reductase/sulfur reductase-like enzyme
MQYVIIGAGPAGVIAAETLRKLDASASVKLIGDEPEPPYSRMAIPYFLVKNIAEEGTYLRKSADYFAAKHISIIRDKAKSIEAHAHTVSLRSGGQVKYDKLLLASGSRPVSPPISGMQLPNIYSCWTLADARNIASRTFPGAKIVLMGAGFIGCIILEALAKSGADLTVIEMGDRMVPRMMNAKAGNMIKQWCINKGVKVLTTTRVTEIMPGQGDTLDVVLDNANILTADLVVSATGVKPNIDFLQGSGIKTDQGVLVNRNMQTNVDDIYAAGDVAQGLDFSTGEYSVQAIQPTASEHGQVAARNMVGLTQALHQGSVNMNVLDTLGLISSSFGLWMGVPGGDTAELFNPSQYRYINLQFQNDVLVGATSIGLTQHIGVLRGLIQSKVKLGDWKQKLIRDPSKIMEAYLAKTLVLSKNRA